LKNQYLSIAKLPNERKIWILRRFYAGGTGCLPPTDPRILAMTPEMVELEFAHIAIDRKLKDGDTEQYEDPDFDAYEKESEELDNRLSDDYIPDYISQVLPKISEDDASWEDISDD